MNKRGFTLIELLGTIALLAMIVLIAVPAVNGMIGKNKKNNCQILKDNIINAAKLYISDNRYSNSLIWNRVNETTIGRSQYEEYLNSSINNPCDNSIYDGDIQVVFKNTNGNIELVSDNILPDTFKCCN